MALLSWLAASTGRQPIRFAGASCQSNPAFLIDEGKDHAILSCPCRYIFPALEQITSLTFLYIEENFFEENYSLLSSEPTLKAVGGRNVFCV